MVRSNGFLEVIDGVTQLGLADHVRIVVFYFGIYYIEVQF